MEETLERIYTIPLRKVKESPRNGRADRAIRAIRTYLQRHMKAEEVWIDAAVNQTIWARGKYTIPSKVRVRARLFDDGVVEVSLPEEETTAGASMREELAEAREKKLEDAHKGEADAAERALAAGAAAPSGVTRPTKTPDEASDEPPETDEEEPQGKAPTPPAKAVPETPEPAGPEKAAKPKAADKDEATEEETTTSKE